MSADSQITEILKRYDEDPSTATWKVQSATVILHKALERIAAKANIVFRAPTILRAERGEAVILVTGAMGRNEDFREEWSIGEALITDGSTPGNYKVSGRQAAYPYAMAEKRAKDRVILKLIGLHGLLYSEEEADEFKDAAPTVPQRSEGKADPSAGAIAETLAASIKKAGTEAALKEWAVSNEAKIKALPKAYQDDVRDVYASALKGIRTGLVNSHQRPQSEAA